ncbi:uncharacterized protein LOC106647151 [Copidosoma floridanum]|uniref:uncharacterized protein LOC106647151 n=1 Tax=Copidosoma floridanum TaxID=29053 RepID=UPI0006C9CB24|nr:uncharacterized protein LOC106647151 [Copidosoma floridanum]XP_014218907.1 uncharacterized protein LOC106647151 [Copidosoma floridanum]
MDLIDFESADVKTVSLELASPLIPAPESPGRDDERDPSKVGPALAQGRRSYESNPFDLIMKKVTDYERNKEDPFERVVEAVTADQAKCFIPKLESTKALQSGDVSKMPEIVICSAACDNNLSILNNSAMNDDSLLGSEFATTGKSATAGTLVRCSSASQNDFGSVDKSPCIKGRRSCSVPDALKNNGCGANDLFSIHQSGSFEDPFNNAFRKNQSSISDSSNLSKQLYLSANRDTFERLNSDSSTYSGLSNISAIPNGSSNKIHLDIKSSFSEISDLSTIPSNATSSFNSFMLSNNTANRAFINTTENTSGKSSDKSDLIKKFYEIKRRISTQIDFTNHESSKESSSEKRKSSVDEECAKSSVNKLVDLDVSSNSVFSDPSGVDDIIVNEAQSIAETFEKLASSLQHAPSTDNNLPLEQTEFDFDCLPPSDDEAVNDLIDLPTSPPKKVIPKSVTEEEERVFTNNDAKSLESEFIEQNDSEKKAAATSLLLDLQKLINKENNPRACKVLDDLQNILGVKCDDNTELLKNCLQSTNFTQFKENSKSDLPVQKSDDSSEINSVQTIEDLGVMSIESDVDNTTESNIDSTNCMPFEDEKSKKNLQSILDKIINKKDEADVVDFLTSIGSMLTMAKELQEKKNVALKSKTETKMATNSLIPWNTPKSTKKSQSKSFEGLSQRKDDLLSKSFNMNSSNVPNIKDKRKSGLLNIRLFQNNASALGKKKVDSINQESKKPHSSTTNIGSESITAKFKKKISSEVVTKKGPLKAMIPLGKMQKQVFTNPRMSSQSASLTPSKTQIAILNVSSSTPNSGRAYKFSKSNPKASSTPNTDAPKKREEILTRLSIPMRNSFKCKSADSLPSLNPGLRRSFSLKTNQRRDQISSPPPSQSQAVKQNSSISSDSRLPRLSPRPVRVRNYSFSDSKTAVKSPSKFASKNLDKKFHRHSVLSPLKNLNKLEHKPTNLASRLGRSYQLGPEKENYV